MILENSKQAKICIDEHDYLALVDAATDILDALKEASEKMITANDLTVWITQSDIGNLEDALRALGEL